MELSKILVENFNGSVPEDLIELEKLPGVGHKTASVVMSQAFGHPAFLWIRISIVWHKFGARLMERMYLRQKMI